jgi:hypothetical protein
MASYQHHLTVMAQLFSYHHSCSEPGRPWCPGCRRRAEQTLAELTPSTPKGA